MRHQVTSGNLPLRYFVPEGCAVLSASSLILTTVTYFSFVTNFPR